MNVFGVEILASSMVIGLVTGATYALLGVGLVLVYRSTKVINFAHGQLGALGATVLAKLVWDVEIPYWIALPLVIGGGVALGAVIELLVVRRLANAPRLMLLVATIGVAQVLVIAQVLIPEVRGSTVYPVAFQRQLELGGVVLNGASFMVLAAVPAAVLGLTYLMTRTPYGLAIRATAENPDAARLARIRVGRVGTLVWALAGGFAVLTACLNFPVANQPLNIVGEGLGPALLLRALVAAMIGGFRSLPLTFVGGLGVGVVEAIIQANLPTSPGVSNAIFFVIILVLLLGRAVEAHGGDGAVAVGRRLRPLPDAVLGFWWVRHLATAAYGALALIALLAPLVFTSTEHRYVLCRIVLLVLPCLSLTLLTGWAGQLSLGQFAFVGIGAFAAGLLTQRGVGLGTAILVAVLVTAACAVLIGLPALRLRGLFVTIATLGFAVAAHQWLFGIDWVGGAGFGGTTSRPPGLAGLGAYYYFCLLLTGVATFAIARLQGTGSGRLMVAVRDNERSASAMSVDVRRVKLGAFGLAGALCGLGGALYGGLLERYVAADFTPTDSLQLISTAVVGGLGTIGGAVLGPLYVVGIPLVFDDAVWARLAVTGIGLLAFLLYLPGGLVSLPLWVRDRIVRYALARTGDPADASDMAADPVPTGPALSELVVRRRRPNSTLKVPSLLVDDVTVRFGGRVALDGVSIEVAPDEIVGLIGSNGAGKSTLMNVISGFQPAESGQILLGGHDISYLAPHARAAVGLGRAFQDARLFDDLTVGECLQVARERRHRSELVADLFAFPPAVQAGRARRAESEELLGLLGLGRYRDAFICELSTGTRRIVELGCLVALEPDVLLLDEPTAGVAQRETEAFGPLIREIKDQLGASVVIIEHDMPLVTALSDRLYCLGAGQVIASGSPAEVIADPAVISSYLGTDEVAINRSGPVGGDAVLEGAPA